MHVQIKKKTNCPGEIEEDSNKKLGFLKFTPSVTSPKGEFHNKMSKFIKEKENKNKIMVITVRVSFPSYIYN